jgi:MtN3 and saliva related transmembrane protein
MYENIIGHVAGTTTCITFIPQLIKVIQEKKADDLSMISLIIYECTSILWIAYGVASNNFIIILYDSIIFVVNTLIILSKIYFDKIYSNNNVIL